MKKLFAILLAAVISIPISSYAADAKYPTRATTNHIYEFISYSTYEEGDELLLIAHNNNNITGADLREQLRKNSVSNQVENIKTISATGIEKILINAELCALVVEAVEGSEYTMTI